MTYFHLHLCWGLCHQDLLCFDLYKRKTKQNKHKGKLNMQHKSNKQQCFTLWLGRNSSEQQTLILSSSCTDHIKPKSPLKPALVFKMAINPRLLCGAAFTLQGGSPSAIMAAVNLPLRKHKPSQPGAKSWTYNWTRTKLTPSTLA